MAAGPITLKALDGNKVGFNHIAVDNGNNAQAPGHAVLDPNGVPLIPAAKGDVQAVGTILGAPAQDGTVAAVTTAVQALLAPLQDLDGKAATATAQATQATILGNILTALGPLATDADLQAATAKLELIRALLAGTLNIAASSLPLPSGAATESTLAVIKNAMLAQASISESLWYDPTLTPVAYYFRQVIDTDGTITYAWKNTDGSAATPNTANIRPINASTALEIISTAFDVLAPDTGTNIGDVLLRVIILNLGVSPPAVAASLWINATTGAAISAPTSANIKEATRDVTVASSVLPTGAASSALQTTGNASLAAIVTALAAPVLASGSATAANQTAGNSSLATMVTSLASSVASLATLVANSNTGLTNDTTALTAISATQTWQSSLLANSNKGLTNDTTALTAISSTQTWQSNLLATANTLATLASEATQTGTLAANNATVAITNGGNGTVGFKLSGTWVGTISAYGTIGDNVYDQLLPIRNLNAAVAGFTPVTSLVSTGTNANGGYYVSGEGMSAVQLVMTPWTSGSASVVMVATSTSRGVHIRSSAADPAYVAQSIGGAVASATNPNPVTQGTGYASMPTGQTPLNGTTPVPVVTARAGRGAALLIKPSADDVWLGGSTVSPTTGVLWTGPKGTPWTHPGQTALYAVSAAGVTATITWQEAY